VFNRRQRYSRPFEKAFRRFTPRDMLEELLWKEVQVSRVRAVDRIPRTYESGISVRNRSRIRRMLEVEYPKRCQTLGTRGVALDFCRDSMQERRRYDSIVTFHERLANRSHSRIWTSLIASHTTMLQTDEKQYDAPGAIPQSLNPKEKPMEFILKTAHLLPIEQFTFHSTRRRYWAVIYPTKRHKRAWNQIPGMFWEPSTVFWHVSDKEEKKERWAEQRRQANWSVIARSTAKRTQ
jgi:hypothetical protein